MPDPARSTAFSTERACYTESAVGLFTERDTSSEPKSGTARHSNSLQKQEYDRANSRLRGVTAALSVIHRRILLEQARNLITAKLGETWDHLLSAPRDTTVDRIYMAFQDDPYYQRTGYSVSKKALCFLLSEGNIIRLQGNFAAHNASVQDVRRALTNPNLHVSSSVRKAINFFFRFVYEQPL